MNVHSNAQTPEDQKRRQIMEAALDLFAEGGFHGAPMAKLASRARVPVGTIYRHFENKEALIHALYAEIKRQRLEATFGDYDPALPLRERFKRLWRNAFTYCISHPREFAFAEQYAYSPFLRDAKMSIQDEMLARLAHFYADGYRGGVFKSLAPEILNSLISGPMNALAVRVIAGTVKLSDAHLGDVIDACWDAIAERS
jgi:AcrR family transcriptional regulator